MEFKEHVACRHPAKMSWRFGCWERDFSEQCFNSKPLETPLDVLRLERSDAAPSNTDLLHGVSTLSCNGVIVSRSDAYFSDLPLIASLDQRIGNGLVGVLKLS